MAFNKRRRPSNGRRTFGRRPFGQRSSNRRRGPKKENILLSKFIKPARVVEEAEEYKAKHTFSDFVVSPLLHTNLERRKFAAPSPIQDKAIPEGLKGSDIVGIANTGTGKTVAFLVPVIDRLLKQKTSSVLIMAPTRELAEQILHEAKSLSFGGKIDTALLIGGAPMGAQLRDLRRRPRLVIGTPGRIKDHLERKSLNLSAFDMIVLDEVDRMLDMGFVNDMRIILAKLNKTRQSFFFSATLDETVKRLIGEFTNNPITISVKHGETTDTVDQNIVRYTAREEKIEKLHELLVKFRDNKVLIFDETKRGVDKLSKALRDRGFRADATHGDKSLGQRKRALVRFKSNEVTILVATDVAARGIDVADITHVINYSTPQSYSDYVHRIGRAGRAGRKGFALTFIESR